METEAVAAALPTALAAMKPGGCSMARMIYAALAAVGNAAISAPMNGPERSTVTETMTTIKAVIAILLASSIRNISSGDIMGPEFFASFRPSKARAGMHNHDRCQILRMVTMDSGFAPLRPGMTVNEFRSV